MPGSPRERRHAAAAVLGLVLALSAVAYGVSAGTQPAGARTRPSRVPATRMPSMGRMSTTTTASYGILIGPIAARHGFTVQLEVDNCGTSTSGLLVEYSEGDQAAALDHSYQGPAPHCSVSTDLGSTVLRVRWGSVLDVNLHLTGTGRLSRQTVRSSCGTSFFESRGAQTTGSATIRIHPRALGRIRFSKLSAHLIGDGATGCEAASGASTLPLSGGAGTPGFGSSARRTGSARRAAGVVSAHPAVTVPVPAAPTTRPTTTTQTTAPSLPSVDADGSGSRFLATFDAARSLVITASSQSPYNPLTIITDQASDNPASGVSGTMSVTLNTPEAFTVDAGDSAAQLVAHAPFATGVLNFSATGDCAKVSDALDGTLTGALVIVDPVFGTITYSGASAIGAAVGNADASLGTC